ncbi:transcriptional regulator [Leptospira kirschneri serovar Pomona]|uniref:Transcriptional regulator n=1 Tax=Leptospira kirschneri serovar Pomona TaxID=561005 RepID=A0A1T1DJ58_9LEPT|nr:ribbon-helix-helix protein, CopG family [Leptospira kirschneri]KON75852.1 Ribbon-helix-helix protein, CopG family [Leptospira kirschneri serovar Mozdok]KPZ75811.1 transcriptional regulator [Leptospira kirschneri serovar Mozdok]NDK07561.1 Transcriptional regulator [Leptospira kirschneri serovar Mozdok]OOV40911.1 transcriptional regulator [Leptospira kirschneri serovar Pomona]
MISLRLPPELERKLDTFARSEGKSRSEIVKESIIEYIKNHGNIKTPFELGEDLFGKHSTDISDLSQNRKKYLRQSIQGKHAKRSLN